MGTSCNIRDIGSATCTCTNGRLASLAYGKSNCHYRLFSSNLCPIQPPPAFLCRPSELYFLSSVHLAAHGNLCAARRPSAARCPCPRPRTKQRRCGGASVGVGGRPATRPRAMAAAWQRNASAGQGAGSRGHFAQCALSASGAPVHPQHAGHCAAAAKATTKGAPGLAAGSPRCASPQRGGSADTQRAPPRSTGGPLPEIPTQARGWGVWRESALRTHTLANGDSIAGGALARGADEAGPQRSCKNGPRAAPARRVVLAWRHCWYWDLHWEDASLRRSERYPLVHTAMSLSS